MDNNGIKVGNGIVGILSETCNLWERRVPLTPSHCARLLHGGKGRSRVDRIIVQPSTKRIYIDGQYEDVGCQIQEDLSECGLILGIKQPELEMILSNRSYAFFSHTHKAQKENMPLLDKIIEEKATLYDYELIVGDNGKRLLAFGKFAGRAGFIDLLHALGMRYLNLGYSTPFLSLGASYMYPSLAAAKAAVISIGEEIATTGLPPGISPIVFIFTGSGNVSQGAQEIFKLLPHTFVDPCNLPELFEMVGNLDQHSPPSRRPFQVYGCVVTCKDMVVPRDSSRIFDKVDYYAHPEHYNPIFHERIAPYASAIVNCMYWEKRYPRLLTNTQLRELMKKGCSLVAISDITCDVGGSIEFINQTTKIEKPFFRFDPLIGSYHNDMAGNGIICLAVDILPTEFPREASQYFGDILCQFVGMLASTSNMEKIPPHLQRACIVHQGMLTSLYEYIPRMRESSADLRQNLRLSGRSKFSTLVSLTGHLFDKFLINEALDVIEAAGGSFRLFKCEVGQNVDAMSYSELEVEADDAATLNQILDSLTSIAYHKRDSKILNEEKDQISLKIHDISEKIMDNGFMLKKPAVLILGAGRVCQPAAEFLGSQGFTSCRRCSKSGRNVSNTYNDIMVIVASLHAKDAEETIAGIPNTVAVQLDVTDHVSLSKYISEVEVVISLLPPSFHVAIANLCIEKRKHLVTASYVDESMSRLQDAAQNAGVTILCEMGLDPGIDHMLAMKMIDEAHARKGEIRSFHSYCGGLPSPAAANNPLGYKFSWNPAGAIRAGRNPAMYKSQGDTVSVDGNELYNSATRFRISDFPAFALEYLPNRNSLVYGDLYGISKEASTIFRGTLRYEGFSEIMGSLSKLGFFDTEPHPMLKDPLKPKFGEFLNELLNIRKNADLVDTVSSTRSLMDEEEISQRIIAICPSEDTSAALKAAKTIRFLGFHEDESIPENCSSAFEVSCARMEQKLAYSSSEQDMVLLHHELKIEFREERRTEHHCATLLEFGKMENGKMTTAMAKTVGIPAAIGALLLLENEVKTTGIVRPLHPEVYLPALELLEAYGVTISEKVNSSRS